MSDETSSARVQALADATRPFIRFFTESAYARKAGTPGVSDFAIGTLATPDRLVPGDGDIPLARILGQVLDAGYAGVFDLELIGEAIATEGYDAAIPRAVEALGGSLQSLGA